MIFKTVGVVAGISLVLASKAWCGSLPPEIRVRVQREKQNVEITGLGLRIGPPSRFLAISDVAPQISRAKISRSGNGWIVKSPGQPVARFETERLSVRGQMLRLGVEPVPYELEVLANPKAGIDVVARLDIETYLAGVLPSEMPASWPIEALKAQAVAARSFVVKTAHERKSRHFDVDSTIMDQVYKFLHEAQEHPEWKDKIARAIDETRGEILADDRQRTVKAFYSADCGCQTEDPKFVWGTIEAFQSVRDPSCDQLKPKQWDLSLKKREVREKIVAAYGLPENSSLRTLQVAGKTPSGRVASVVANLDVGGSLKQIIFNSQEFRKIFGFDKIRSTDFRLLWLGDRLQILGSGIGHAVGLCQTGAQALAQGGMKYNEILKVYYPKLKLVRGKRGKSSSPRQSNVGQPPRGPVGYLTKSSRQWC